MKNVFLVCSLLVTIFATSISIADDTTELAADKSQWGLNFSFGISQPHVSNDPFDRYLSDTGTGLGFRIFHETPFSNNFSFHISANLLTSIALGIDEDVSFSHAEFLAIGGTLGKIHTANSIYFSGSVGYGLFTLGDSGDPAAQDIDAVCQGLSCITLVPDTSLGGSSDGIAYRLALGRTLTSRSRFEFVFSSIGGEGADFPTNSKASLSSLRISFVKLL